MSSIMYLILGHLIADYQLQCDFLAQMKGKNNFLLMCHVLMYSLFIAAILDFVGIYATWKLAVLIFSHTIIDYWKCHYANKETALTTSLYIDQFLHVLVLAVINYF